MLLSGDAHLQPIHTANKKYQFSLAPILGCSPKLASPLQGTHLHMPNCSNVIFYVEARSN